MCDKQCSDCVSPGATQVHAKGAQAIFHGAQQQQYAAVQLKQVRMRRNNSSVLLCTGTCRHHHVPQSRVVLYVGQLTTSRSAPSRVLGRHTNMVTAPPSRQA